MNRIISLLLLAGATLPSFNARASSIKIDCSNAKKEFVIDAEGVVSSVRVDFELYKMSGYVLNKVTSKKMDLKFYNYTIDSAKTNISDLGLGLGYTLYVKFYDTNPANPYGTYGLVIQTKQKSQNTLGLGFTTAEFFTGITGGENSDLVLGNHFNLVDLPLSQDLLHCSIIQK